ncbi:hypothetical protein E3A20_14850, partial [Planctomyces bekefii]
MKPIRPRVLVVGFFTLLALYFSVPSIIYLTQPAEVRNDAAVLEKKIPPGFPKTHINLGLDLQGGVQLVLGVRLEQAIDNKLGRIATDITRWASDEKLPIKTAFVPTDRHGFLRVQMNPGQDFESIREKFRSRFADLVVAEKQADGIDFSFRPEQVKTTKASALEQAERVIRN